MTQQFEFGTKAETLADLAGKLVTSVIPRLYHFRVSQWRESADAVLREIEATFPNGTRLAVRSSAVGEDGSESSMAGEFTSVLDVAAGSGEALQDAVEKVIDSYTGDLRDQVLVQEMVGDIGVSGVITTYALDDGAPYYVLSYDDESGKPDSITGGVGEHKTVLVHREAAYEYIDSDRVKRWIAFAREIENLTGNVPLDIEFAESKTGELYLLQARRIAVESQWNREVAARVTEAQKYIRDFLEQRSRKRRGLVGTRTILGEMPDWNPAEIIGTHPRRLARSLYRYLVTDSIWAEARAVMGYRDVTGESLMVTMGGRPFIDVRNSFNSFLPSGLRDELAAKLVDAWLDHLDANPNLHDKVEFEVAYTILDFTFDEFFDERYVGIFNANELSEFRTALSFVTRSALDPSAGGTLRRALAQIEELERRQARRDYTRLDTRLDAFIDYLAEIEDLLEECKTIGTLPFSIIARHAFIAETMLRSAVKRGALTAARVSQFKSSIQTVSGELSVDFAAVVDGRLERQEFMRKYGHLRPGTYDILSPCYRDRDDLFAECAIKTKELDRPVFRLLPAERDAIESLLGEIGVSEIGAGDLLRYAELGIVGREHAKFVFTRNLSDVISLIERWGGLIGLQPDDLSHLSVRALLDWMHNPILQDNETHFKELAQAGRREFELTRSLRLSYLIRNVRDAFVVPLHRGAPNFVTDRNVQGRTAHIDSRMSSYPNLQGKIVCIENADPGYDWVFSKGIAGLITKFGGANSHMAIRCAEFSIAAAIGCGEETFRRIVDAKTVELNCADKVVRPVYG